MAISIKIEHNLAGIGWPLKTRDLAKAATTCRSNRNKMLWFEWTRCDTSRPAQFYIQFIYRVAVPFNQGRWWWPHHRHAATAICHILFRKIHGRLLSCYFLACMTALTFNYLIFGLSLALHYKLQLLYIYPVFENHFFVFKKVFFWKSLSLCMVSIQVRFEIKTGLLWPA